MRVGLTIVLLCVLLGSWLSVGCEEEDEPVATVMFCHALGIEGEPVEMVVKATQGDQKTVFRSSSDCCTPCSYFKPEVPISLVLSDFTGELYRTEIELDPDVEYILHAEMFAGSNTPALGLSNLTEKNRDCEKSVPAGWSRCGSID